MNNDKSPMRFIGYRRELFALVVVFFVILLFIYYLHFPPMYIVYGTLGFVIVVLLINYPTLILIMDLLFVFVISGIPSNFSVWSYKLFIITALFSLLINRLFYQKRIIVGSGVDIMLLLSYIIWLIISCLVNQDSFLVAFIILILMKYMIVFILINLLDTRRMLMIYIISFVAVGTLNNIVGILQVLLRWDWYGFGFRACGFFANPNGVGYLEAQLIPFIIILLTTTKNQIARLTLIILFLLCPITAIMSQSRGTTIATLVVLAGIFLVSYRNLVAFYAILIAVILVTVFWQEPYTERLRQTFERKELLEESRGYLYKAAIIMIIEHPVFGVGPYKFGEEFANEYSARVNAPFNNQFVNHNGYLEIMSFGGFPALIFIMTLVGVWIKRFLNSAKKARSENDVITRQLCLLIIIAIVGFLVVAMFESLVEVKDFYYFMGINIALTSILVKERQEKKDRTASQQSNIEIRNPSLQTSVDI